MKSTLLLALFFPLLASAASYPVALKTTTGAVEEACRIADTKLAAVKNLKTAVPAAVSCQKWILKNFAPLHANCDEIKMFLNKKRSVMSEADKSQAEALGRKVKDPVYTALEHSACDTYVAQVDNAKPGAKLPNELVVLADAYQRLIKQVNEIPNALGLLAE